MSQEKKYVSLSKLSTFLDNLYSKFASTGHKHTLDDITNYVVDSQMSSTSTNPVQNKVLDAEFEAISAAMNALEDAIDGKSESTHNHDDKYYTEAEIDSKLSSKSDTDHKHDSLYDTKGAAATVQQNLNVVDDKIDAHTGDSSIHVTATNKANWNAAHTHSQSTHARVDATKVADSTTNGNILVNDSEVTVYSHPNSGVTAGTYKSVTVNAQGHVTAGSNPTTLSGYGITDAETKTDASAKLTEAKTYADQAATKVKNDLLNGAGTAYDTLKELGDLIDDNVDAIDALEAVAANKSDKDHKHDSLYDTKGAAAAVQTNLDTLSANVDDHTGNSNIHVTYWNKIDWSSAYAHSLSDHSSDWNETDESSSAYIRNKPFSENGINITWDRNHGDQVGVPTNYSNTFYKVSDEVIMLFDITDDNTTLGYVSDSWGDTTNKPIPLSQVEVKNDVLIIGSYEIFSVPRDNMVVETNWGTLTFPTAGTYFLDIPDSLYVSYLTIANTEGKIASSTLPKGIVSQAEFDKHVKNRTWEKLYDTGEITKNVNAFSWQMITGYSKIKIALKCVNVADSAGETAGAVNFQTASGGSYYRFSTLFPNLISNTPGTTAAMAEFTIMDGFIICENALRSTNAPNMMSTAYNKGEWGLTSVGGGMMYCSSPVGFVNVSAANNSANHFFGAGSRLIVWGCKE